MLWTFHGVSIIYCIKCIRAEIEIYLRVQERLGTFHGCGKKCGHFMIGLSTIKQKTFNESVCNCGLFRNPGLGTHSLVHCKVSILHRLTFSYRNRKITQTLISNCFLIQIFALHDSFYVQRDSVTRFRNLSNLDTPFLIC